jgi:YesN/AraC family two-component response regulator
MQETVLNPGSRSEMKSAQKSKPALSLLCVEDDKPTRDVLSLMIAMKFPDVAIHTAGSGESAIELFNEQMPNIVVTDINMPGMDGIRMAGEIKRIKADTRFIVLTGYSDENYLNKFSEIGINHFIVKPIEFGKLFALIEKCIDEIKLQKQDSIQS